MSVNRPEIMKPMIQASADDLLTIEISACDVSAVILHLPDGTGFDPAAFADLRRRTGACPLYVRVENSLEGLGEDNIRQRVALKPDGLLLSGCRIGADIQNLAVRIAVAEAEAALPAGSVRIIAEIGGQPDIFLSPHSLAGLSERLSAIILDGAALTVPGAETGLGAPLQFARAVTVLRARQAGVACYDILPVGLSDITAIDAIRSLSRIDGFTGVVARDITQWRALAS